MTIDVVRDFRADPTGVRDSGPAIRSACFALNERKSGTVVFPAGTFKVFSAGTTYTTLGDFSGCRNVRLISEGAQLLLDPSRSHDASYGTMFRFQECSNVTVDGFDVDGPTVDTSATAVKGLEFVRLLNGCSNVRMPHNRIKGCIAGLIMSRGSAGPSTIRSVHVGQMLVTNCWYGINGQYECDGLLVDQLVTDGVHRSLFLYGANNVWGNVTSKNPKADDVYLCSLEGYGLSDIHVFYRNVETTASPDGSNRVVIAVDEDAGPVHNIQLDVDIKYLDGEMSGASAFVLKFTDAADQPDTVARGRVLSGIRLSGRIAGQSHYYAPVFQTYVPTTWLPGDSIKDFRLERLTCTGTRHAQVYTDAMDGDFTMQNVRMNGALFYRIVQVTAAAGFPARVRVVNEGCDFP